MMLRANRQISTVLRPLFLLPRTGLLPQVSRQALTQTSRAYHHHQHQNEIPSNTHLRIGVLLTLTATTLYTAKSLSAENAKAVDEPTAIEPATKKPIPATLTLIYGNPPTPHPFALLGLGVRQVTLLKFNVYTIGYYLSPITLRRVKSSPKWTSFTQDNLDSFIDDLVRGPGSVSVRIEPTRNTDGPHLRNGLMRMLTKCMGEESTLSEAEKTEILDAMDGLRASFPTGKIGKGEVFILTKTEDGNLRIEYEGKEMVVVRNKWVAERLLEGYLRGGKSVISEKLRRSVAEGLEAVTGKK